MRRIWFVLAACGVAMCLMACSVQKTNTKKIRDIEFTVLEEEKVPEELQKEIEKRKEQVLKMTYADQGYLYIVRGYGEQELAGYSIEVVGCYETSNALYLQTNLIGPAKDEKLVERVTYPYVVVKMEFVDKNVVFE